MLTYNLLTCSESTSLKQFFETKYNCASREKPTQLATSMHTHRTGEPGGCGVSEMRTLDSVKVDLNTGFAL